MIDIKYSMFFDRDHVLEKVKNGTKSTLSKFGAYVRTSARSSIRKRKKPGQPGSPPSSHEGSLRKILFGYDSATEGVVVGPVLFKQQKPTAPNLLEFSGVIRRNNKVHHYRSFPFMAPALEKETPKFAGLFTGAVQG